jgi:mono/diheme cytochrome c family protein
MQTKPLSVCLCRILACLPLFLGLSDLVYAQSVAEPTIDFQTQIQPLLAESCLACHGQDASTRSGGLRLDQRDGALQGGDSGKAVIVPGDPESSLLIQRVTSADQDSIMPPPSHGHALTQSQIDLLKQWIVAGAEYAQHWAFVPPVQQPLPVQATVKGISHPIDAFVDQRLSLMGLQPSAPASPWVLCRRLYLDIIGLPPSVEELLAFQRDGFDATVEKLLASDRYGERWARPWLDVARYSDTNGYEKDMRRDQWAWRDWVIRALNSDMPYDQFIIQQIAGDLLPDATQDQRIATGFLRNSMINEEGAIIPEEFRMVEMFDRIDCLGKAVLGLSTQCAQCHSHKFDPLAHDEYYGLFAFLNNTYEAQSWVYNAQEQQQISQLLAGIAKSEDSIRSQRPQWESELNQWTAQLAAGGASWQPMEFNDLNSVSGLNHPVQIADKSILMLGHRSDDVYFIGTPELNGATGMRLEVLTHSDLPFGGPGRDGPGLWSIREIELLLQSSGSSQWSKVKLTSVTADFEQKEEELDKGKTKKGPVAFLIDGSDATLWSADRGPGLRNCSSVAVIAFESPLEVPVGTQAKVVLRMNNMPGCVRCSLTRDAGPQASPVDYDAVLAACEAAESRSAAQQAALFSAWRRSVAELAEVNQQIAQLWSQYPAAETSVLHLKEREPAMARHTHVLSRGEWNRPMQRVEPHTPAALPALQATDEPPRLQFARWLVDPRSPLASRVAVNRVWQTIFGRGLVETAEDFGTRAPVPEYREILDWLAVDLMQNQWSNKHLIRKIVSSRTYQQASGTDKATAQVDPDNRWLTRGARYRLDAEVLRDMAMSVSVLIHNQLYGPSVLPPVPESVLDYNYVKPDYWTPTEGVHRYRRTIYGFRKRSMPDPSMSAFDAPNGDFACARRIRSNTPLAALTSLNETIFVESSRAFALRVLREGGSDDTSRINFAFLACMSRYPTANERLAVQDLLAQQRQRVADGWLNARELTTGTADKLPDLPESTTPQDAAAWTIAARVLLNLDETISRN